MQPGALARGRLPTDVMPAREQQPVGPDGPVHASAALHTSRPASHPHSQPASQLPLVLLHSPTQGRARGVPPQTPAARSAVAHPACQEPEQQPGVGCRVRAWRDEPRRPASRNAATVTAAGGSTTHHHQPSPQGLLAITPPRHPAAARLSPDAAPVIPPYKQARYPEDLPVESQSLAPGGQQLGRRVILPPPPGDLVLGSGRGVGQGSSKRSYRRWGVRHGRGKVAAAGSWMLCTGTELPPAGYRRHSAPDFPR